jgi:hypothetical protein
MNNEWLKLRPFNGDIKNGFEELVCQLARAEQTGNRVKFIRIAAPDGGVEAYSVLSNNDEYGWQAKFFTKMGDSQWTQLDKSIRTAIDKRPNLKKYFICIPLDRQDPKIKHQEWFMDRWNAKVKQWTSISKSEGRKIEFVYWGNSELFDRLTKPENEGKLHYWFGQEEFSDKWFSQKLEESIKNIGKRYSPAINFDLPIAKIFEGLSHDKYFQEQFRTIVDSLLKDYHNAISRLKEIGTQPKVETISTLISKFRHHYEQIDITNRGQIDQAALNGILEESRIAIDGLIYKLHDLDAIIKSKQKEKKEKAIEENIYRWDIERLRQLNYTIDETIYFINSSTVSLSNNPFMILSGEAGIGKSHLLADIAIKREKRNQSTILLLGQHFTQEEPWSQIKRLLHINCERDTFLSSLDSKAESNQSRILIFIDAINEGEGKKIWKNHIYGFISAIRRFPNLGVVFSVRTSYENHLIPDTLTRNKEIVRVNHSGFSSHEYEASKLFFDNYKIKQPSIPLLHPEFSNPLFLILFCEALYKKGLHEIPDGYQGISTIINFYLESVNSKISEKHNLPTELNITQSVAKKIAGRIAEISAKYIRYADLFQFITCLTEVNAVNDKSQFFQDLISEGLLTQNLYWDEQENNFEGIYFSYERFSDHLITSYLIENFLDNKDPRSSFKVGTRFHELVKDEYSTYYNKGIVEALSIQLPESVGLELYEIADYARLFEPVALAFIESIVWRKKETIQSKLKDYINEVVIGKHDRENYFLNTILLVTSQPNHFFNSDFLHKHLMGFNMADRDAWWTTFIHGEYPGRDDEISSIRRMIDWAWTKDSRENISDESIRLMCQTMIWFLTSTNKTLRDSATKAIVCLLEDRLSVIIQLLKVFEAVNDPYLVQRLYAIAYGCAVRTNNVEPLKDLGAAVFELIFNTKQVIPDILLRDYARGIIEFSVFKGHKFEFDLSKIRPPFKSVLPQSFPNKEDTLRYKFNYQAKDYKDYQGGMNAIISSMNTAHGGGGDGDFGRYVFKSAFANWKDVDTQGLSNLAVKWIVEKLGYDVEKHGAFDRKVMAKNLNRNFSLEERIGKKYQWIIFHDLLARVSDNFTFYEKQWDNKEEPGNYNGPWEPYVRDIDPSITIKWERENTFHKYWWNNILDPIWNVPNKDWIFNSEDLPNPLDIISVLDPGGTEWLLLEQSPSWHEPPEIGKNSWDSPHKNIWYQINSYIITKKERKKIYQWSKEQDFIYGGMPEASSRFDLFSREYYWSPACESYRKQGYIEYDWSEIFDKKTGKFIGKLALTTLQYLCVNRYDSLNPGTLGNCKPTEIIFNLLQLKYSKIEGEFLSKDDEVICFDPCLIYSTPSCLLVRKADLMEKLEENDLEIYWTVYGEKSIMGGETHENNFIGGLNISGVVHFEKGKLKYHSRFTEER